MNQTTNYGLTQWEATDRILMEDFNSDNTKTDAALKENADNIAALETAVTLCGNCKIVYGSYTGTGTYGNSDPCVLTFDRKPIFVYVIPQIRSGAHDIHLKLLRNVPYAISLDTNSGYVIGVEWTDNSVKWYSISAVNSGEMQLNTAGAQYFYVAFLAADE